jgi:hypothetical protein
VRKKRLCISETIAYFNEITRLYIAERCHLYTRCCQNLNSHRINIDYKKFIQISDVLEYLASGCWSQVPALFSMFCYYPCLCLDGQRKTKIILSDDSQSSGLDLNPKPSTYVAGLSNSYQSLIYYYGEIRT